MKKLLMKSALALLAVAPFATVQAQDGMVPHEYQETKPDHFDLKPLELQERANYGAVDLDATPEETNRHYCLSNERTTDARLILNGKPGKMTRITFKFNGRITQITSWKKATGTLVGKFSLEHSHIAITATDSSWKNIKFTSESIGKKQVFNLRMM